MKTFQPRDDKLDNQKCVAIYLIYSWLNLNAMPPVMKAINVRWLFVIYWMINLWLFNRIQPEILALCVINDCRPLNTNLFETSGHAFKHNSAVNRINWKFMHNKLIRVILNDKWIKLLIKELGRLIPTVNLISSHEASSHNMN